MFNPWTRRDSFSAEFAAHDEKVENVEIDRGREDLGFPSLDENVTLDIQKTLAADWFKL